MGPKPNDKCPQESEAEGDLADRCGGSMTTEVEIGVTGPQITAC